MQSFLNVPTLTTDHELLNSFTAQTHGSSAYSNRGYPHSDFTNTLLESLAADESSMVLASTEAMPLC